MPLTKNGKIDRAELRKRLEAGMTHQMMIQKIARRMRTPFYLFDLDPESGRRSGGKKEILGESVSESVTQ